MDKARFLLAEELLDALASIELREPFIDEEYFSGTARLADEHADGQAIHDGLEIEPEIDACDTFQFTVVAVDMCPIADLLRLVDRHIRAFDQVMQSPCMLRVYRIAEAECIRDLSPRLAGK